MRNALAVGLALVAFTSGCQRASGGKPLPDPAAPGTYEHPLTVGGTERRAFVHVPKKYDPKSPPPLVLAFHGGGGGAERYLADNGWAELADKEGFVAVAPEGLPAMPKMPANFQTNPRVWHSGQLPDRSPRTKFDDVKLVTALLDDLAKKVPHDPKRVYLTGHSNGGGMGFRLAAEVPERFAALATVAGQMSQTDPQPKAKLPTLYIHGTKDPILPAEGGEVKLPWGTRKAEPIRTFLDKWATAIGCETELKLGDEKDGLKRGGYAKKEKDAAAFEVIFLVGHGHAYPGGKESGLPERVLGPNTTALKATPTIWQFFQENRAK
jgi:polyhydroxybutyrate depolymerase